MYFENANFIVNMDPLTIASIITFVQWLIIYKKKNAPINRGR